MPDRLIVQGGDPVPPEMGGFCDGRSKPAEACEGEDA